MIVHFTQSMLTDTSQFILFFLIITTLWFMNNKINILKNRVNSLENRVVKDIKDDIVSNMSDMKDYDKMNDFLYDDKK